MIRQIQENEFTEAINRDITTIVKFEADWCGPCKAIMPSVEKISDEWSDKEVEFVSLDVDQATNIAEETHFIVTGEDLTDEAKIQIENETTF